MHNWKIGSLYVEYDFNKEKWINPVKKTVVGDVYIDDVICNASFLKAQWWLSKLVHEIRGNKKSD